MAVDSACQIMSITQLSLFVSKSRVFCPVCFVPCVTSRVLRPCGPFSTNLHTWRFGYFLELFALRRWRVEFMSTRRVWSGATQLAVSCLSHVRCYPYLFYLSDRIGWLHTSFGVARLFGGEKLEMALGKTLRLVSWLSVGVPADYINSGYSSTWFGSHWNLIPRSWPSRDYLVVNENPFLCAQPYFTWSHYLSGVCGGTTDIYDLPVK